MKSEVIRDHGDEFAICGFTAVVLDSVAEVRVECVNVTSIPCNLNGVAYGALNAACRGLVFLGDRGVEYLGDGIDDVAVFYRQQNSGAQILVALDVRGYTDLMYDLRNLRFYVGCSCHTACNIRGSVLRE